MAAFVVGACGFTANARAQEPSRAGSASPWIGGALASFALGERALVTSSIGPEVGLVAARWIRLSARLLVPLTQSGDVCGREDIIYVEPTGVYTCQPSDKAKLAVTFSAGVSVLDTAHWLLSPGLMLARTDVGAHGTLLGVAVPVEWIFSGRFRLGAEIALGTALGQEVTGTCRNDLGTCTIGSSKDLPNEHTLSAFGSLSFGWAFAGTD